MHIAFVCNEYPPAVHGGVGSLTQTIARRLVAAGHRATVVGSYPGVDGPVEESDEGVAVLRLPSPGPPGLRPLREQRGLWRRLRAVHRDHPVDLVEGPEPSFWAAPRRLPFPTLVRMNGGHRFFAEAEGRRPRNGELVPVAADPRQADHGRRAVDDPHDGPHECGERGGDHAEQDGDRSIHRPPGPQPAGHGSAPANTSQTVSTSTSVRAGCRGSEMSRWAISSATGVPVGPTSAWRANQS